MLSESRFSEAQEPCVKESSLSPPTKLSHFTNHTTSYNIKNPAGDLFTYIPSGKVRSLSTVVFFSSSLCLSD